MQTTIPQITNKRLCLISLGCPKNLVDSEKILGILGTNGYVITAQPQDADYILINTCAFIQPAVKESLDMINNMKKIKEKTGGKIIVFGCLSRKNGDILFMDKDIDAVVGPDGMYKLPDILQSLQSDKRVFSSPHSLNYPLKNSPRLVLTYPYAYLKITEGCSNFCSYCLIPKLRGPLKSFPENEIIKEAKELSDAGIKELIVIGQDTTSYGADKGKNAGILQVLEKLEAMDFKRLRLLYLRPERVTEKIIEVIANSKKICRYFDIPLQHIHPEILKKMNRPLIDYKKLIEKTRNNIPDVCIRTTFIAGFPGETEKHFQYLADFVKETEFDRLGAFPYYREKETPAYSLPGQISEKEKNRRFQYLLGIQKEILKKKMKRFIGKSVDVLVDEKKGGTLIGRTEFDAPDIDCTVKIKGQADVGDIVNVRITEASTYTLTGSI